jgi:spore coat-associated protein N
MKKLLVSLMSMVMVIAMVGGGAFAYFTDSETSTGNSFTAGTLDLKLNGADAPVVKPIDWANKQPGDSGTYTFNVQNAGSLAGFLNIGVAQTPSEGTLTEPEQVAETAIGHTVNIADEMNFKVTVTIGTGSPVVIYNGMLKNYAQSPDDIAFPANTPGTVLVEWSIDGPTVGNEIQGDSVLVDMAFNLTQQAVTP